jgi:DNA polymerase III delta prime subunit
MKRDSHDADRSVTVSRLFVDRLLGMAAAGLTPTQRIDSLKLLGPTYEQLDLLEDFLRSAATQPLFSALAELADKPDVWVNALRIEGAAQIVQGIEIVPWRTIAGHIARWSGLTDGEDLSDPPVLLLSPDADRIGDYSRLEVRWRVQPDNLEKGAVEYRVAVVTDMDEELASREVPHGGAREEKCRFTNDDFTTLSDDALVGSKVVIQVVGNDQVPIAESEEFIIRFGEAPEHEPAGVGKKVRTFSEGLAELGDRESVSSAASTVTALPFDVKSFVLLRTQQRGKNYRVHCPSLIHEVDQLWAEQAGAIGRWRVRVRSSGVRATQVEFVSFSELQLMPSVEPLLERVGAASRRMAERFAAHTGVGQIYDDRSKGFDAVVKEYLLAWAALLEEGHPQLALSNTVEVQTLSGRTVGLIVLPSHPLRVAWHVGYDNLVFDAAFEQKANPKDIRKEFVVLDGSMFPPFLPGLDKRSTFVFADTLGFHAVGMVPDDNKEPKAAVAMLAGALGEAEDVAAIPTVGSQSAQVLGNEILKYVDCHNASRFLHIHALRPGDGLTVARALGRVQEQYREQPTDEEPDANVENRSPAFVLELYPSHEQRGLAGRFIAEAREKRRTGAGVLSVEDRWMLESWSLTGGMNMPKLRWARKAEEDPTTPAHIAVAFDTFDSRVVCEQSTPRLRPPFAYGLLSFLERQYTSHPSPLWRSSAIVTAEGEKHPSDRTHTERLSRIQQAISRCVARHLAAGDLQPILRTEISSEKALGLHELHRLCDWVITLDRNAGIEYFDSPKEDKDVYDTYVIDCVPEREDLGCLQLITSTTNVQEVRSLLDSALDEMGLSRSRRNAEFLMGHLKALSGRLAIRLTGQKAATSELIALALSHANCQQARPEEDCWTSLDSGFIVPVDDVQDLIPPLSTPDAEAEDIQGQSSGGRARPDLIYVSIVPRRGLQFQFVEVKYRRHLRAARSPDVLEGIRHQVDSLRRRWDAWYSTEGVYSSFRAVRRAKLARVLHFYADKANRHYLQDERYAASVSEIDRMIERGGDYSFAFGERLDRGWVFCPEYAGARPLELSPANWETRVFLFGPGMLPDCDFRHNGPSDSTDGEDPGISISTPVARLIIEPPTRAPKRTPLALAKETKVTISQPTSGQSTSRDGTEDERTTAVGKDASQASHEEALISLGTDVLTGAEIRWNMTVRGNPHLLLAGLPGMGKTTCLVNLCKQMLAAKIRPIVFSYHQDIDEHLERLGSGVRFLDFRGLGFNPLQIIDRQSRMAHLDVAGALRDIFAAIYPELGDIQGERIRKAIKHSFIEKGWEDANAEVRGLSEPPFGRFVEILQTDPKPDHGLRSLLARLEELQDYGFFRQAESQQSLWDSEQPVVIRIHATQNDNLQKAFASLVFYGLYKDMFRRGTRDRITHAVVFDEAHRAARLKLIPTMAKECRKYGISLVLASQEAKDFNNSLFSVIANYLVLRLNEADAKVLVRNVATSDQERTLIDKIKQMDRFKALYFTEAKRKPSLVALLPQS